MDQKLLQEVAHLMRKYYDDRGARLESYAEQIIGLCDSSKNEQLLVEFRKETVEGDPEYLAAAWERYKKYIADVIEIQVNQKFNTIKIYMKEN
jgi:hypothetical protein